VNIDSAIMFDFSDGNSASLACEMLQQLGYSPVQHESNRVHIHVEGSDLTSALEIAQAYGGTFVEQSEIEEDTMTGSAYALNAITIPAHVVNEDLIAAEEGEAGYSSEFLPDPRDYDYFSGDVHA